MNLVQLLTGDEGSAALSHISPNDLSSLCRVSKACQLTATPLLYRRVELVFHFKIPIPWMTQIDDHTNCYRRQRLFCETMSLRPDLAKLVRSLLWTLSFPLIPTEPEEMSDTEYTDYGDEDYLHETDPSEAAKPYAVWEAFTLMDRVSSLDLRMHHSENDIGIISKEPSPCDSVPTILFPTAHTIRLSGLFPAEDTKILKSILSHAPSRIKCLDIDHMVSHESTRFTTYWSEIFVGWSNLIFIPGKTLPSITSLTYCQTGAFSLERSGISTQERESFSELSKAFEIVRSSIQHIRILITPLPRHGCVREEQDPDVPQRHFAELLVPT